jgi:hypothetical protein
MIRCGRTNAKAGIFPYILPPHARSVTRAWNRRFADVLPGGGCEEGRKVVD